MGFDAVNDVIMVRKQNRSTLVHPPGVFSFPCALHFLPPHLPIHVFMWIRYLTRHWHLWVLPLHFHILHEHLPHESPPTSFIPLAHASHVFNHATSSSSSVVHPSSHAALSALSLCPAAWPDLGGQTKNSQSWISFLRRYAVMGSCVACCKKK